MLNQDARSKALFTQIEKVVAAVPPAQLKEGKPQNPLSSVHWTLENAPGGYKITIMRSGIIVSQKTLERADLFIDLGKGKWQLRDDAVALAVMAMFEGIPAPAKAA